MKGGGEKKYVFIGNRVSYALFVCHQWEFLICCPAIRAVQPSSGSSAAAVSGCIICNDSGRDFKLGSLIKGLPGLARQLPKRNGVLPALPAYQ